MRVASGIRKDLAHLQGSLDWGLVRKTTSDGITAYHDNFEGWYLRATFSILEIYYCNSHRQRNNILAWMKIDRHFQQCC
jgi:hypothetical protein